MPDGAAEHGALVQGLSELLAAAGFDVAELDRAGFRMPRSFGGRRPDAVGRRRFGRSWAIGEAKAGPDLYSRRSLEQFYVFSRVLAPGSPPRYACFCLAVSEPLVGEAWRALRASGARLGNTVVVGQSGDRWLITSPPLRAAESWPGSGPEIRARNLPCGARFLRRG